MADPIDEIAIDEIPAETPIDETPIDEVPAEAPIDEIPDTAAPGVLETLYKLPGQIAAVAKEKAAQVQSQLVKEQEEAIARDQDPRNWSSSRLRREAPKPQTPQEQAIFDATIQKKKDQEKAIKEQLMGPDVSLSAQPEKTGIPGMLQHLKQFYRPNINKERMIDELAAEFSLPREEVKANFDELARRKAESTGVATQPTNEEFLNAIMIGSLPLAVSIAGPKAVAKGIAAYMGVKEGSERILLPGARAVWQAVNAEPVKYEVTKLRDLLPENEILKNVADLSEFLIYGAGAHSATKFLKSPAAAKMGARALGELGGIRFRILRAMGVKQPTEMVPLSDEQIKATFGDQAWKYLSKDGLAQFKAEEMVKRSKHEGTTTTAGEETVRPEVKIEVPVEETAPVIYERKSTDERRLVRKTDDGKWVSQWHVPGETGALWVPVAEEDIPGLEKGIKDGVWKPQVPAPEAAPIDEVPAVAALPEPPETELERFKSIEKREPYKAADTGPSAIITEEAAIQKWVEKNHKDSISHEIDGDLLSVFTGRDNRLETYSIKKLVADGEIESPKPSAPTGEGRATEAAPAAKFERGTYEPGKTYYNHFNGMELVYLTQDSKGYIFRSQKGQKRTIKIPNDSRSIESITDQPFTIPFTHAGKEYELHSAHGAMVNGDTAAIARYEKTGSAGYDLRVKNPDLGYDVVSIGGKISNFANLEEAKDFLDAKTKPIKQRGPIKNPRTLGSYIKAGGGILPSSIKGAGFHVREDFLQHGLRYVLNKRTGKPFSTWAADLASQGLIIGYKEGDSEGQALMDALKGKQLYTERAQSAGDEYERKLKEYEDKYGERTEAEVSSVDASAEAQAQAEVLREVGGGGAVEGVGETGRVEGKLNPEDVGFSKEQMTEDALDENRANYDKYGVHPDYPSTTLIDAIDKAGRDGVYIGETNITPEPMKVYIVDRPTLFMRYRIQLIGEDIKADLAYTNNPRPFGINYVPTLAAVEEHIQKTVEHTGGLELKKRIGAGEIKPFEVDEKLLLINPKTKDVKFVSYRGPGPDRMDDVEPMATVWTGTSQIRIPMSWLSRQVKEQTTSNDRFRTPDVGMTVPDMVSPGDIIQSNYSERKYRVEKVNGPYYVWEDPAEGGMIEYPSPAHYSIQMSDVDAKRTKEGKLPANYSHYSINNLIVENGKIINVNKSNTDEVRILEKGAKQTEPVKDIFTFQDEPIIVLGPPHEVEPDLYPDTGKTREVMFEYTETGKRAITMDYMIKKNGEPMVERPAPLPPGWKSPFEKMLEGQAKMPEKGLSKEGQAEEPLGEFKKAASEEKQGDLFAEKVDPWKGFGLGPVDGSVRIYRGVRSGQEGEYKYYSPSKEWARQFTQSGQEKEIVSTFIKKSEVYVKDPLPEATSAEQEDAAIQEAIAKGYSAIMLSEGKNEPNSILRIPKSQRGAKTPSGTGFAASAASGQPKPSTAEKIAKLKDVFGGLEYVNPVEMPELVALAKQLFGAPPHVVKATGNALGRFVAMIGRRQAFIKLVADMFKDPELAAAVIAHEIGHGVDWLPDYTLKRGNLLGRMASLNGYLKDFLPEKPGAPGDLTDADRRRLRAEAEKLVGQKIKKDAITTEFDPQAILDIFNSIEGGAKEPALLEYIKRLSTEEKKSIVKAAMEAARKGEKVTVTEVKQFNEDYANNKEAILRKYEDLIREEIKKRNLFWVETVRLELKNLTQWWHPFQEGMVPPSYLQYRYSGKELYAEFISVLLNAPGKAQEIAPTFFQGFFNYLDAKPEVKALFLEIQEALKNPTKILEKREEALNTMFKGSRDTFNNILAQKEKAKKSIRFLIKYHLLERNAALLEARNKMIETRPINPEDDPKYLIEENSLMGSFVKSYLDDLDPIYKEMVASGLDIDKDFGIYVFMKRVIGDRAELANPGGHTPETAQRQLDYMQMRLGTARYAELENYVKRVREWFNSINTLLKEDILTPAQTAKVEEANDYAPFRVTKYLKEYASAGFHHQIGYLGDIENPGVSMVLKAVAMLRLYKRNQIIKKIGGELVKGNQATLGKVQAFKGQIHVKEVEGKGTVLWRDKGRWRVAYVDPYIADSFKYDDTGTLATAGDVLRRILLNDAIFRPLFITYNLGFQAWNLRRDFSRFWANTPKLTFLRAIKEYLKSVPSAYRRVRGKVDPLIQQMEREGALNINMSDMMIGKDREDTEIDLIMRKYGSGEVATKHNPLLWPARKLFGAIKFLGDVIETIPKVAGFKYLDYMDPHERAYYVRNYIGTPNYKRRGKMFPIYNNLMMFSNIIMQGQRADFEVAFRNPKTRSGFWWKKIKANIIPKIIGALMAAGWFGKAVKDNMDKQSEYDKTNYITIPLGEDERGKAFYMRIPQDETGRFIGALFWKTITRKSPEQAFSVMAGNLPSAAPLLEVLWNWGTYLTGGRPRDIFRSQDILTEDEKAAGGWESLEPMLRWTANQSGAVHLELRDRLKDETLRDRFLQLTPVINRLFRLSDYGKTESLREVMNKQRAVEAQKRLREKDVIIAAAREGKTAKQAAVALPKEDREKFIKKYQKAVIKSTADPVERALMSATTNAQKVEVLRAEYERYKSFSDFKRSINSFYKNKIISGPVAQAAISDYKKEIKKRRVK